MLEVQVQFYSKNNFEKLVHLVVFVIRINNTVSPTVTVSVPTGMEGVTQLTGFVHASLHARLELIE